MDCEGVQGRSHWGTPLSVQVYKALRRGTTEVAIKKLNPKLASTHASLGQLHKEVAILQRISYHSSVVQFYGAYLAEPAMLCMEYMEVRLWRAGLFKFIEEPII